MTVSTHKIEKQQQRRQEILLVAADLIGRDGYGATSLDAIVEAAGCSKSTIYKLFGNKKGLLEALTEEITKDLATVLYKLELAKLDIEALLTVYAEQALTLILSEKHIAVVKAIITETWQFPELGTGYYRLGPYSAQHQLAVYLGKVAAAGQLNVKDPEAAAVRFFGLLLWDLMMPMIVGAKPFLTQEQVKEHAAETVSSFLLMYAN